MVGSSLFRLHAGAAAARTQRAIVLWVGLLRD